MSNTKSWSISETVGIPIINTKVVTKFMGPSYLFFNDKGSIKIKPHAIIIEGQIESAAQAFAEDMLKYSKINPNLNYLGVIGVTVKDKEFTLTLLEKGVEVIDPGQWIILKKHVEKICNNLTALI